MLEYETPDPGLVLLHEFHDLMAQEHSSSWQSFLVQAGQTLGTTRASSSLSIDW